MIRIAALRKINLFKDSNSASIDGNEMRKSPASKLEMRKNKIWRYFEEKRVSYVRSKALTMTYCRYLRLNLTFGVDVVRVDGSSRPQESLIKFL